MSKPYEFKSPEAKEQILYASFQMINQEVMDRLMRSKNIIGNNHNDVPLVFMLTLTYLHIDIYRLFISYLKGMIHH